MIENASLLRYLGGVLVLSDTTNIRVNINVSSEIHSYYKEQASRAGVSMSAVMSIALLRNMEIEKSQSKKEK